MFRFVIQSVHGSLTSTKPQKSKKLYFKQLKFNVSYVVQCAIVYKRGSNGKFELYCREMTINDIYYSCSVISSNISFRNKIKIQQVGSINKVKFIASLLPTYGWYMVPSFHFRIQLRYSELTPCSEPNIRLWQFNHDKVEFLRSLLIMNGIGSHNFIPEYKRESIGENQPRFTNRNVLEKQSQSKFT